MKIRDKDIDDGKGQRQQRYRIKEKEKQHCNFYKHKKTRYSGWGDGNTSGSAWEQGGLILSQAEYFDFV